MVGPIPHTHGLFQDLLRNSIESENLHDNLKKYVAVRAVPRFLLHKFAQVTGQVAKFMQNFEDLNRQIVIKFYIFLTELYQKGTNKIIT